MKKKERIEFEAAQQEAAEKGKRLKEMMDGIGGPFLSPDILIFREELDITYKKLLTFLGITKLEQEIVEKRIDSAEYWTYTEIGKLYNMHPMQAYRHYKNVMEKIDKCLGLIKQIDLE